MAGIEQLEIHSKSYIVRWVKVDEGHTISWSVQPHKKSINFAIVKHPGTGGTNLVASNQQDDNSGFDSQFGTDGATEATAAAKQGLFAKRDASTAQDQLAKKGFIPIKWHGKCEADKVSMGTYDVTSGGMFGLVFDNTFSKQTSKTATFVLLTYPTGNPPQTAHHLPNLQTNANASASKTSLGRHGGSPRIGASDSVDSLTSYQAGGGNGGGRARAVSSVTGKSESGAGNNATINSNSTYHVGTLLKRRRKKGQGHARRFFSLDYTTCTLSYYHNRGSSALRGAIPLSLAAIAADERRREITIDSGAEVWHLKASNPKEFSDWAHALERASRIARGLETLARDRASSAAALTGGASRGMTPTVAIRPGTAVPNTAQEEDREWKQVESLVSRIVGTRDALRRLVKDMAVQKQQHQVNHSHGTYLAPGTQTPTVAEDSEGYFSAQSSLPTPTEARRPFWKRKVSTASSNAPSTPGSSLAVPSPVGSATPKANGNDVAAARKALGASSSKVSLLSQQQSDAYEHCAALLNDLDSVVVEFSTLLSTSKRRRMPASTPANLSAAHLAPSASRKSYESTSTTDEFFDAEAGDMSQSRLMIIDRNNQSEEEDESPASDVEEIHETSSVSSVEDEEDDFAGEAGGVASLFPPKPKSLTPLPITDVVKRRKTIPPARVAPPSLIAFVRKNVGKDLSTISMPVSANEPLSLLQRVSEQLEYAQLLAQAARQATEKDRLLYVTAFAISQFSNGRAKERAIRKPFNPLLGETFELVREDQTKEGGDGYRLVVEKVTHRPVRLAMQADGASWSFAQSPAPTQKFWGKSAELTTEGRVRVVLRIPDGSGNGSSKDEYYSWNIATMFLRNVVMGEKYVEPVGTMHVINESTGAKAAVEFKSKGVFGGRGEEVQVELYHGHGGEGRHMGAGLSGTWTTALKITPGGKEIWRVGSLVENAANTYGLTTFAAGLNEITPIEEGKLPPTDTRLRPDQRFAEQGDLDSAEEWKVKLEEAQRVRRRQLEERGEEYKPRWFVKVAGGVGEDGTSTGEEVWRLKLGKDGYWEERAKAANGGGEKAWSGALADLFSG